MKSKTLLLAVLFFTHSALFAEVLSFSKAYELALKNAHHIRASSYNVQAEKEKINQESAQLYPQIDLSGFYKKSEYERNPDNAMTRQGLFNYAVSARQALYNPEIVSRMDAQEARSKHAQVKLELEKKELAQELFDSYLDLLKSQNRIELLKAYLNYSILKLDEIQKRYEMQLANKMDLLEMRVERDTARIELQKEERLLKVNRLKFQNFIGRSDFELPALTTRQQVSKNVALMQTNVANTQNLEESLYVQRAYASIDISKNESEIAEDGHLPRVSLDASYSFFETDDPLVDSQFNSIKYVMLTVNLPLFSGGATSSRIASSRLLEQAALEDLYSTKKEVQVMYDEYLSRFQSSVESVEIYNDAYDSAELYVEAIEKGYQHGLKSITDLNDAKNKYYEVRYKYIENIYELVHSYVGVSIVTNNFENIYLLDALIDAK